ncbi:MAG: (d)CMP kinase [Saprospiraceae bacterium]|nr:(d)CMP kinase [Saprospiraceae bacterium]
MLAKIVVAIDGHSGCGKSTLARDLAREIGFRHIDSGSMYRAVTFYFLENKINAKNQSELSDAISSLDLSMQINPDGTTALYLGEQLMTTQLRTAAVNESVSEIASIPAIRSHLVAIQQGLGQHGGVVMDGRDIGSVVFPGAQLKIFLTASLLKRVERRRLELERNEINISADEIRKNLKHRDHVDSTRKVSPLLQMEDAVLIDNTNLSRQEQLAMVVALVKVRAASTMELN